MDKIVNASISIDWTEWSINFTFSIWLLICLIVVFLLAFFGKKVLNNSNTPDEITETEITCKLGEQEIKYKIVRNYLNVEIAYRIYIELITRKAALPIDKDNDVIVEVYNSWYKLFEVTREEIKKVSGSLLTNNEQSEQLIKLTTDILNLGLRPHLTLYQAKFRKWYSNAIKEESDDKSPQEIQTQYPEFNELIASMEVVNQMLMNYANELKKLINDKPKDNNRV